MPSSYVRDPVITVDIAELDAPQESSGETRIPMESNASSPRDASTDFSSALVATNPCAPTGARRPTRVLMDDSWKGKLSFQQMNYTLDARRVNGFFKSLLPCVFKLGPAKQIIDDVSGVFKPGMNAIMGRNFVHRSVTYGLSSVILRVREASNTFLCRHAPFIQELVISRPYWLWQNFSSRCSGLSKEPPWFVWHHPHRRTLATTVIQVHHRLRCPRGYHLWYAYGERKSHVLSQSSSAGQCH